MNQFFNLCLGILVIADGIIFLIGYFLIAAGISDALGPFAGVISAFTIFPILILSPLGIGNNPKITSGWGFIVVSLIAALVFAGIISLLGAH